MNEEEEFWKSWREENARRASDARDIKHILWWIFFVLAGILVNMMIK